MDTSTLHVGRLHLNLFPKMFAPIHTPFLVYLSKNTKRRLNGSLPRSVLSIKEKGWVRKKKTSGIQSSLKSMESALHSQRAWSYPSETELAKAGSDSHWERQQLGQACQAVTCPRSHS